MTQIINLLSSSPPQLPVRPSPRRTPRNRTPRNVNVDFSISDFKLDSSSPLKPGQPAKKRKLTPPAKSFNARVKAPIASIDAVFDVSSEPDLSNKEFDAVFISAPISSQPNFEEDAVDLGLDLPTVSDEARGPSRAPLVSTDNVITILSDDTTAGDDPIASSSQPHLPCPPTFTSGTAGILARLGEKQEKPSVSKRPAEKAPSKPTTIRSYAKQSKSSKIADLTKSKALDDIDDSSQVSLDGASTTRTATGHSSRTLGSHVPKTANLTAAEKAAERDRQKDEKRLLKEREKASKQLQKELERVNKDKTKNATPEMLIDLPSSLRSCAMGNDIKTCMDEMEVTVSYFDETVNMVGDIPMMFGSIVKWRRRVEAEYDEVDDEWKPLSRSRVDREKHILVILTAEELCTIALVGPRQIVDAPVAADITAMKANIDTYMTTLRTRYPAMSFLLIVQGLNAFLKRSEAAKNREFAAAVRGTQSASNATTKTSRKRKPNSAVPELPLHVITSDDTDTLFLHLQLRHQPLKIHHTTSISTTAHQVNLFTKNLALRPYRRIATQHNLQHANFCMATNQIKTGEHNARDTWVQMLQQVQRVTASMAHGIVADGWSSAGELVREFKKVEARDGRAQAKKLLENVKKAANKDGGWSDKKLGSAVSRRLYGVFMDADPGKRDGIA